MQVAEKDTYQFQRARIVRIAGELAPGKTVEFDEASTFIRFRIRDNVIGVNLTEVSAEHFSDELADKSDHWLRSYIKHLSNGKL